MRQIISKKCVYNKSNFFVFYFKLFTLDDTFFYNNYYIKFDDQVCISNNPRAKSYR
jgi:hypothetical protein